MPADRRRRRSAAGALGLVLLTLAATAAGQGADPRADMARTVLDQLAAFRRDDWTAAYGYASAAIQSRFGLEEFRQMVTGGYGPIARSASATVSHVEVVDPSHGLVEVRVEGANGETGRRPLRAGRRAGAVADQRGPDAAGRGRHRGLA
jgi:hypothetical protein